MKVKLRIRVIPFEGKAFTAFRYVEMPHVAVGMTLLHIRNRHGSDDDTENVVDTLDWDADEPDVLIANLIDDDHRETLGSEPEWLRREYCSSVLLENDYRDWQVESGAKC